MPFAPMFTAPRSPTTDIASERGLLRHGPQLALLASWDEMGVTLIRGCWRQIGDEPGRWWDYENGEPIDLVLLGWAAMPDEHEMVVLRAAASQS